MHYGFEIRDVPTTPVLYVRATCPQRDIGPTLARLLPKVFQALIDLGVRPIGPPFCRYVTWRDEDCDLECGIEVDGLVSGVGEIEGGVLGGGKAAFTVHQGPYTELHGAYMAMEKWMKDNGKHSAGAPFDLYITDPGKVPDPTQWKTEIYWPVV